MNQNDTNDQANCGTATGEMPEGEKELLQELEALIDGSADAETPADDSEADDGSEDESDCDDADEDDSEVSDPSEEVAGCGGGAPVSASPAGASEAGGCGSGTCGG